MTAYSVNVRAVAEFALEGGDLAIDIRAMERMREGVEGHRLLEGEKGENWRLEEPVAREDDIEGIRLRVQGRADAVERNDGRLTIEEIKTTSKPVSLINADDYPAHWAQAQIYAFIIAAKEGYGSARVALLYYNMSGARTRFTREYTLSKLEEIYFDYTSRYARWLFALETWKGKFMPSARALKFPFEGYRDGQREMARNVYIALRDKKRVMVEAPTGIGKTAAALFGAVKAAGEGLCQTIFYLTARTTGRKSAEHALDIMRSQGLRVRSVTISAKEKVCVPHDVKCAVCPYSRGYFDRRRAVLVSALDMEKLDEEAIMNLAYENTLCPFELSLDLAENADVVICDYNYVFDLRIRLSRFFTRRCPAALLIDEAHNLPERAREMYSAEMSGRKIAQLRKNLSKDEPLYASLTEMLKYLKADEDSQPEALSQPPEKAAIAAQTLSEEIMENMPDEHPFKTELIRLMLDAAWFYRVFSLFTEDAYRTLNNPEGKRMSVKLMCCDPTKFIDESMKKVYGTALFSATLTPPEHYARRLAVSEDNGDAILTLPSPFLTDNQLTVLLPLKTRFKEREATLNAVAQAIEIMYRAKEGNYMACFPSYAYLEIAYRQFRAKYPDIPAMRQSAGMKDDERAEFIARIKQTRGCVVFTVLGGVFAEGVDLPGDNLLGAAIITVGIPQIGGEREILRQMNDDGEGEGYDFAYVYPGFRRVTQAAGRVIRTENDRGVVMLIDERYKDEKYRELMPAWWRVNIIEKPERLRRALENFWQ